jgi:predicted nucleic acid-binding protein
MVAVSNTSPLNYLVQIDCVHILPTLFAHVSVSGAVLDELQHQTAPPAVRAFASNPPEWISVRRAPAAIHPSLAGLHPGDVKRFNWLSRKTSPSF